MDTPEREKLKLSVLRAVNEPETHVPDKRRAFVLVYDHKGASEVHVAGKTFSLTPGWFLLSNYAEEHRIVPADRRSQCYLAEVCTSREGVEADSLMAEAEMLPVAIRFQSTDAFVRFDTEENRVLLTLMELSNELQGKEQASAKIIDLLLGVLLVKLERAVQAHGKPSGFSYVSRVKQYIRENLSTNISVQSAADHVGIHRSYLMHIFREQTGMSVNTYINRMRVTQATVLLTDSDLTITEIAFLVGFNNRQNFYLTFQKIIGCSPAEYRRDARTPAEEPAQ